MDLWIPSIVAKKLKLLKEIPLRGNGKSVVSK